MAKKKDDALENFKEELKRIKIASVGSALKAAFIILGDAQKHVPVEYGDLRASGYVQKHPDKKTSVQIGFNSTHAFYVHENIEMKWKGKDRKSGIGVYWGPNGEAKFLEKSIVRKKKEVFAALVSNVKRKGSK